MISFIKNGFQGAKWYVRSGCFIFVLALSVFGWGLHSKLSLYDMNHEARVATPIAKLLSEQERPPSCQTQHIRAESNPVQLHVVAFYVAAAAIPLSTEQFRLERSVTWPKAVAFSFDGPSLLRPPPFRFA
ncbi:MAG TPA: hypothetical protein VE218_01705 [Acidobacteriaceae bacterium]|nr:hypothetical protein [Acidobacteriaceae bacterium]